MKPKHSHTKKKTQKLNQSREQTTATTPDEFSFAITKIAVSQICKSGGFKGAQSSALEKLTVVTTKYLQELAQLAASYSHASHRTESNIFDLINALHDLNLVQGFVGASKNGNTCLLSCSLLKEIECFVKYSDETPFAKPVPRGKNRVLSKGLICGKDSNEMVNSRGLSSHIPKWLPVFPDLSTYKDCRGSVCEKRRNLWENSELVEGCFGGGEVKVREQSLGDDLAIQREKVRFKIGVRVDKRNGLCSDENEDDERNNEFKRKRC